MATGNPPIKMAASNSGFLRPTGSNPSVVKMACSNPRVKEILRDVQLIKIYLVLVVTGLFFVTELVASHFTHSLTLLVDSYHSLYNVMSLIGCLLAVKLCERPSSMKNTFGWARMEVVAMLVSLIFLSSLCFALLVEAIQTLCHASHRDATHHPLLAMSLGAVGLLVNALCFMLIGGYTHHQGTFFSVTAEGEVVMNVTVDRDSVRKGHRCFSSQLHPPLSGPPAVTKYQGPKEIFRDLHGCTLVIISSTVVYIFGGTVALYADPLLAIVSVIILVISNYPFMKESGLILLQTIPDYINIDHLRSHLKEKFPAIISIHELHVWQLTPTKLIATAHITFLKYKVFQEIEQKVIEFFQDYGITQVTIQPEFIHVNSSCPIPSRECFLQCNEEACQKRQCCELEKGIEEEEGEEEEEETQPLMDEPDIHIHGTKTQHDEELVHSEVKNACSQVSETTLEAATVPRKTTDETSPLNQPSE